jgi:hypothetical protein
MHLISLMEADRRARRRIKFIGYLIPTGRRIKYIRVERWE